MEIYKVLLSMVKKGNKLIGIVANENDLTKLDFLSVKLGLKPTQIYRLALLDYYRKVVKED